MKGDRVDCSGLSGPLWSPLYPKTKSYKLVMNVYLPKYDPTVLKDKHSEIIANNVKKNQLSLTIIMNF